MNFSVAEYLAQPFWVGLGVGLGSVCLCKDAHRLTLPNELSSAEDWLGKDPEVA